MGQLNNLYVSSSYQGLLKMTNSLTGVTGTLQTVQTGDGGNSALQLSKTAVNITGTFTVNGQPVSVDTGSIVTTASFNAYTSSNDSKVNSLISKTGSYINTGSLTSDQFVSGTLRVSDLFIAPNVQTEYVYNNGGDLNVQSVSDVILDAGNPSYYKVRSFNSLEVTGSVTASAGFVGNLQGTASFATSASYAPSNPLPSGIVSSSAQVAQYGYAITGSNTFIGNQTITGSINVSNTITALSASVQYAKVTNLEVVYETSSVIFSSGSNILGDASNDIQTLWGTVNIPTGPVNITGALNVVSNTGHINLNTNDYNNINLSTYTGSIILSTNNTNGQIYMNGHNTSISSDTFNLYHPNANINLWGDLNNNGGQYTIYNSYINGSGIYGSDIFGGFQVQDTSDNNTLAGIAGNTYAPESSGSLVGWIGGGSNNPEGSNTALIFRKENGHMDVYKQTTHHYNLDLSSSLNVSRVGSNLINFGDTDILFQYDGQNFDQPKIKVGNDDGSTPYPGFGCYVNSSVNPGNIYGFFAIDDAANPNNNAGISVNTFTQYGTGMTMQLYGGGLNSYSNDNNIFYAENGNLHFTRNKIDITGSLVAPQITGSLQGLATSASIVYAQNTAANQTHLVAFTDATNTYGQLQTNNNFTYNPNTKQLNATASYANNALSSSYAPTNPGVVSGSAQISYTGITNVPSGIISSSAQLPAGIVSGSAQVAGFGYATTGSNNFIGNEVISGSLTVTGSIKQNIPFVGTGTNTAVTNSFIGNTFITGSGTGTAALRVSGSINASRSSTIGTLGAGVGGAIIAQGQAASITANASGSATATATILAYTNGSSTPSYVGAAAIIGDASYDNELYLFANSTKVGLVDFDTVTQTYSTTPVMIVGPNAGTQPAPQFPRGMNITGSLYAPSITGSLQGTASYATQALSASYAPGASIPAGTVSGSAQIAALGYAITGSNTFVGNEVINGTLFVNNSIYEAISVSGSMNVSNGITLPNIGTQILVNNLRTNNIDSFTSLGSYNLNLSSYSTGSINIDSKGNNTRFADGIVVTGSVIATSFTGSLQGTASYAIQALSASYAPSAALPAGLVSGSSQIIYSGITGIPSGLVSGSSQITYSGLSGIPSGIISSSAQLPAGLVSGSSQVVYSGLTGVPSGLVSGSSQVSYTGLSNIPSGIISGSAQLPAGLVSGSSQVSFTGLSNIPAGLVSGSSQITYSGLSGIPSGIISGSAQLPSGLISGSSQISGLGYAITGSNRFTADQIVTGSIYSTGQLYSNESAGNEGGQLNLALAQSGNTLTGSISFDVYNNKVRLFEAGGTNRGGYWDISTLAAGVGTNLAAGGGGAAFPYTGSAVITGSLVITGSASGNVNALSIASQTASLDLNNGNFFTLQLVSGSATNINPSNIKAGQTINILLSTTGSGTVTFPTSVKQISGSAYVPTTGTSKDIITLVSFDSTNLYLVNVKNLL